MEPKVDRAKKRAGALRACQKMRGRSFRTTRSTNEMDVCWAAYNDGAIHEGRVDDDVDLSMRKREGHETNELGSELRCLAMGLLFGFTTLLVR